MSPAFNHAVLPGFFFVIWLMMFLEFASRDATSVSVCISVYEKNHHQFRRGTSQQQQQHLSMDTLAAFTRQKQLWERNFVHQWQPSAAAWLFCLNSHRDFVNTSLLLTTSFLLSSKWMSAARSWALGNQTF